MVRIAVAGVGHLGQHHARVLHGIDGCTLSGVFDTDKKRAREIAQRHGAPVFDTYEALLAASDAVDIAVTTTHHHALGKAALEAGLHVFVEKPITSELWQGEELVALAEANDLRLGVGHIERFNPVVLEAQAAIDNPMFIESHRLAPFQPRGSDVPVILDLMIHDIDLILAFVNSEISGIHASGVSILTPSIDIANARVEFANGAIANVTSSRVSMKTERKLRFFQKDAYISMDFQAKTVKILRKSANIAKLLPKILTGGLGKIDPAELVDITEVDASTRDKDALTCELEAFVLAVEAGSNPLVDGRAGLRALRVAHQIIDRIIPAKM
ncbi:MAG: Gfo/Idh/MocA family oxidoreductase [Candidatus Cloacimonetes bacterium]|nr:Gfo/Idh/MocA family oxidoreductase [Candidatus Cloacimonadota bacterium]